MTVSSSLPGGTADAQIMRGTDDKCVPRQLLLPHVSGLLIVADVAHFHGPDHIGILMHRQADQRDHLAFLLHKAEGLRENHDVPLVTAALHARERDAVRDAAVQKFVAVDFHNAGYDRHGSRGAEVFHILGVAVVQALVDRLSGLDIGADRVERSRIGLVSLLVERIEFIGNLIVAELDAVQIAGLAQRFQAAVSGIAAEAHIVADRAADLPGLIIAAEDRARRDAHDPIEFNSTSSHPVRRR